MRVILTVFDAMRTFDRAVTRAEIERESGLGKRAVEDALCGLMRRGLLVIDSAPRRRGLYGLVPGAQRPEDQRGRYERDEQHRHVARASARARHHGSAIASYSPARPPSHNAQPGAARLVVKGILDVRRRGPAEFAPCALEQMWKKR